MKIMPMKPVNNLLDLAKVQTTFRNPDYHFEVSSRLIAPEVDPVDYLKIYYIYLDLKQIDSVFGNAVYPSRFYGGRIYNLEHSLTDQHIKLLHDHGKGVTLTLTNHHFSAEVYRANLHFLRKHHQKGNGIVCTNDELAQRIRDDFPEYTLKASLIKNLNTVEKVRRALNLYDRVVIPMDKNDDDVFLRQLPEKSRIVLFANANCAYNCPARTCYAAISQIFWGKEKTSQCSKAWLPRPDLGHVFFDVDKFGDMGFRHFKLVPNPSVQTLDFLKAKAASRTLRSAPLAPDKSIPLYSFPKCGRTWLRFLLAHYFNLAFELEIPIDLQTLFTLLPNENVGLKGVEHFQFGHIPDLPLIISSHKLNDKQRGILLLRAIPDVVVSDYFQHLKFKTFKGTLDEFIRSDNGSLHRYCRYLNTWAQNEDYMRQHVLTYERLHHDAAAELEKVLIFLGLPIHEMFIESAVKKSLFKQMQQVEKATGHAGMPAAEGNQELLKVRKGEVGGYINYLTTDEIENLFRIAHEILTPQARMMLKCHDVATGLPD